MKSIKNDARCCILLLTEIQNPNLKRLYTSLYMYSCIYTYIYSLGLFLYSKLSFLFYSFQQDWVGLPAGVKFDPTDQELMEHLEAKVLVKDIKSHPLIDEFIPTIEGEDGICYTHPEKLPGT